MTTSIQATTKSRGRPKTTGRGTPIQVRALPPLLSSLDAWIATQPDPKPSRPEAIRRLVEAGLTDQENDLVREFLKLRQQIAQAILSQGDELDPRHCAILEAMVAGTYADEDLELQLGILVTETIERSLKKAIQRRRK